MKASVQAEPRPARRVKPVRVIAVDDREDILEALQTAAMDEPGIELIEALQTSTQVLKEVEDKRPQVIVMDLNMPGEDPMQRIREMHAQFPELRIIAYTGHDDARTVEVAFEAGARTVVSKGLEPWALFEEVRRVADRHPGEQE